MLTRIHGIVTAECDTCGEVLDTETRDFDEARGVMRAQRWKTAKVGGVWCHYCPACADKYT